MALGCYVIPSDDYVGEDEKAPRMKSAGRDLILPDLDVARVGKRQWWEIKTKTEATWTRITQRYEHGIPLRHYHDYLEVERVTGTPVMLGIYERKTGAMLWASLVELSAHPLKREYTGSKMSNGGMVFWPVDAFRTWRHDSLLEIGRS